MRLKHIHPYLICGSWLAVSITSIGIVCKCPIHKHETLDMECNVRINYMPPHSLIIIIVVGQSKSTIILYWPFGNNYILHNLFINPNLVSHYLKCELHSNYYLKAIILFLVDLLKDGSYFCNKELVS